MLTRLLDFLDKNSIYKHQFGFQKNKSTTQAVFDLYTKIVGVLDKRNYTCSVFLAKAFDTVDHKILLSKLLKLLKIGLNLIQQTTSKL